MMNFNNFTNFIVFQEPIPHLAVFLSVVPLFRLTSAGRASLAVFTPHAFAHVAFVSILSISPIYVAFSGLKTSEATFFIHEHKWFGGNVLDPPHLSSQLGVSGHSPPIHSG
jgi:hypothetical protein